MKIELNDNDLYQITDSLWRTRQEMLHSVKGMEDSSAKNTLETRAEYIRKLYLRLLKELG